MPSSPPRRKIAIVGSGVAGLGAAWALKDCDVDVHIFEKSAKLGGHTNTQPFRGADGEVVNVDTGFIVMNAATYPNFLRFLREVGVDTIDTEMTFGVSRDYGLFEWSGEGKGIFAQRRNLFRPRHWRMIFDIVRFNQFALDLLADDDEDEIQRLGSPVKRRKVAGDMSIGEYLDREGYSQAFRDDYLIPMTAAVWSTSPDKASLDFPARTLVRFMWNHHLLSTLAVRPPWMTIPGGSQKYIDAIVESFPPGRLHIHTSCEVANVLRPTPGSKKTDVEVSWINAQSSLIEGDTFAHCILATHGDEILPILSKHGSPNPLTSTTNQSTKPSHKNPKSTSKPQPPPPRSQTVTPEENALFSSFQTTQNICYLHSDPTLLPTRPRTWTAWNYLTTSTPSSLASPAAVSLTYNMNLLQHLPLRTCGHVLVTMNPPHPPAPHLTQGKFLYRHPLYTTEAVRAQKRLDLVQGARGVSYAGAWTKYGFHEDGFSSGLRVALEHCGGRIPFEFVDSTFSRGHRPELCWRDYVLRLLIFVVVLWIRVLEVCLRLPAVTTVVPIMLAVASRMLDLAEVVGVLRDPDGKVKSV